MQVKNKLWDHAIVQGRWNYFQLSAIEAGLLYIIVCLSIAAVVGPTVIQKPQYHQFSNNNIF